MKKSIRIICFCAFLILFGTGCVFSSRKVRVYRDDSSDHQREYFRNELINPDGLTLESENFLRGNLIMDDLKKDPEIILNKLNDYYKISENPKYLVIAADLCRYLATQSNDDTESIRSNLSAFYYCTAFAQAKLREASGDGIAIAYDFTETQTIQDYNEACCGVFSFLNNRNLLDADSVPLQDIEGHQFIMKKPIFRLSVPRDDIEDFSLCSSYTIKDLLQMNRRPGIGIPLVAKVKAKQVYSSLKTPKGLTIPVTLLLECEDGPSGETILQLLFIDTSLQETYLKQFERFKNFQCSMALDFSTPLGVFLDDLTKRNLLLQMLTPFKQESTDGLYMIEPYQPNKIPVVFIHGLMSSPETWVQMVNSLKNDPSIRKRYQFWFFSYSTGMPVLFSAQKLRTALLAAQKEFCTSAEATENFNKMVLVGHSMGGMLTRMMVQKDPHYLAETSFNTPWDEIKAKLTPEDFQLVETYSPCSLPFVHRVIFMAVPHRGAELAQSFIADLGTKIIRLPAYLLDKRPFLNRISEALNLNYSLLSRERFYTGIDGLNPDSLFVRVLGNSKLRDDVIYHSVIGNKHDDGDPGESDGIVPYWSSHMDGAASEFIVKSGHNIQKKPAAIREVLRILLLHLKSADEN